MGSGSFGGIPVSTIWPSPATLGVRAGGNGSTAALSNSVTLSVNGGGYSQANQTVLAGDTIANDWDPAKLLAASHGQIISGEIYEVGGSYSEEFNLTIIKQPTGGWSFTDLTNQPVSTQVTSAAVTPTGMNAPAQVTIDGGTLTGIEVSVNGGAFTNSPGTIESGQTLVVRGTTGTANTTTYSAIIGISGSQQTWNVTTSAATATVSQPSITAPTDGTTDLSDPITVTSSTYTPLNGAGTHTSSTWEIYSAPIGTGAPTAEPPPAGTYTLHQQYVDDTVQLTSIADIGTTVPEQEYYVRVKYKDDGGVESVYSSYG